MNPALPWFTDEVGARQALVDLCCCAAGNLASRSFFQCFVDSNRRGTESVSESAAETGRDSCQEDSAVQPRRFGKALEILRDERVRPIWQGRVRSGSGSLHQANAPTPAPPVESLATGPYGWTF